VDRILTSTWAPTAISGPRMLEGQVERRGLAEASGPDLQERMVGIVRKAETLGIDNLLVAQRWWGTGAEIEAATYDCLAMTAFFAAVTSRIRLVTAIHPGFFQPSAIAKWGASIDRLTGGRWAVNVTSGWHLQEFDMFGADCPPHDERYARSTEFIQVLRGAWSTPGFSFDGEYYCCRDLVIDPSPVSPQLEVWQGGQSPAAMEMAAAHSDWMFLNGGPPAKIGAIIERVRTLAEARGRTVRFALYAIPHCRESDALAEAEVNAMVERIDPSRVAARRTRVGGAQGMWQESDDPLTVLDSNEGYASRLIGSPDTILQRVHEFHALGVDCFHLTLNDELFNREVLPRLNNL
jgi:FMNH2-dependent dimethyl sulfone monooxygenase